jgi:prepilin-type processing-associated H-X9-DG protein
MAWEPNRTYVTVSPNYVMRDVFVGSYGFNRWLNGMTAAQSASLSDDADKYIALPATQTDRIPVTGDCIEEWAMPRDTDDVPTDLQSPLPHWSGAGKPPPGPSGTMAYFCIDRHRRAINLVFLDGHAQRVELSELWMLKWNNQFTPRQVHVPD